MPKTTFENGDHVLAIYHLAAGIQILGSLFFATMYPVWMWAPVDKSVLGPRNGGASFRLASVYLLVETFHLNHG